MRPTGWEHRPEAEWSTVVKNIRLQCHKAVTHLFVTSMYQLSNILPEKYKFHYGLEAQLPTLIIDGIWYACVTMKRTDSSPGQPKLLSLATPSQPFRAPYSKQYSFAPEHPPNPPEFRTSAQHIPCRHLGVP